MRNYVLMNDRVAKKIFKNSKVSKELTARILSEILKEDYNIIYNNIKLTSEEIGINASTVDSKADIMLEDNTMLIDIEICWTKGNTRQRQTDTYVYQLYLGQLKRSKDYKNMKKIIQILIKNYDYFKKDKLIYDVVFMEQNLHIVEDNFIHKYHINLDKLKNMSYNILKKKENKIERLLYFLLCENDNMLKDIYKGDKFMEEVVKEAKEIAGYFDADLYLPEEEIVRRDREEAIEEGYKEGFESGKTAGREEGIKQGIKQGIQQKQNEMIINMYNNNISLKNISDISNLSIDEINKIIKENY